MKTGLDWYKREPVAFLGGMQGMTARQIAVYNVVIDLMYQHGGAVNNDPSWFAGWIKDVGASAARKTVSELIEMGRLELDSEGMLTNKIVKNSAKTKQKLSETRAETGRKGGINSGVSRAADKENNALDEARASSKNEAEKRREEKKETEDTKVSSKKGTRLPLDWSPAVETIEAAIEIGLSRQQASAQADRFRDYWHGVAGAKGVKLDWPATWRNWCRKALEDLPRSNFKADDGAILNHGMRLRKIRPPVQAREREPCRA